MRQEALINHDVLHWARIRSGLEPETVAHGITSDTKKLIEWEEGEARPTIGQARKLANRLHIPFGYFYLSEPPDEKVPIPDLRTRRNRAPIQLSADVLDEIELTIAKQRWYREYLVGQGHDPLPFVGSAEVGSDVASAASKLAIEKAKQKATPKAGSGNQINNILSRNSRKLTTTLVTAVLEGRVGYSTACELLGVKTNTIRSLADQIG